MPSVKSTDAARVSTNGTGRPSPTGSWHWGVWVRLNAYSAQFMQVLSWHNASTVFYGIDSGEVVNNTTLDVYCTGATAQSVATGSYTGWVFVSGSHVAGTSNYKISFRNEGAATLSTFTLVGSGEHAFDVFYLFNTTFGDPCDTNLRSFWFKDSVLSDADLLTASSSLSAPSGTNVTFLPLDDHTTAGTNAGTGANWTVTGTLTTTTGAGSEPAPSLPGKADAPIISMASQRIARNTLLRM